jgi:hypothetical protein
LGYNVHTKVAPVWAPPHPGAVHYKINLAKILRIFAAFFVKFDFLLKNYQSLFSTILINTRNSCNKQLVEAIQK